MFVCCSALALSALALALSVYATVYVDERADRDTLERLQSTVTQGDTREWRVDITNLRARVQGILTTTKAGTRTKELAFISGIVSPGMSVRGIQVERVAEQPSRITLALSAKERAQLLTFIDLLRANTQVAKVEYPTSALIKSTDITTNISFSYTP